jgi:hypothetical protein
LEWPNLEAAALFKWIDRIKICSSFSLKSNNVSTDVYPRLEVAAICNLQLERFRQIRSHDQPKEIL